MCIMGEPPIARARVYVGPNVWVGTNVSISSILRQQAKFKTTTHHAFVLMVGFPHALEEA